MSDVDGEMDESNWKTSAGPLALGVGGGVLVGGAIGLALGDTLRWLSVGLALGVVVVAAQQSTAGDEAS